MGKLSDRKCASVAALCSIHHVTPETAAAVRHAWRAIATRQEARAEVDRLIGTHGVEYLGTHKRTGHHLYYCNAGDPYAGTVLFAGLRMYVGCWGDLAEKNLIREPSQY